MQKENTSKSILLLRCSAYIEEESRVPDCSQFKQRSIDFEKLIDIPLYRFQVY